MRPGGRTRLRRQDADPSQPDRALQQSVLAQRRRDRAGAQSYRGVRSAGEQEQGRGLNRRPHGRAHACRDGQADGDDRGSDCGALVGLANKMDFNCRSRRSSPHVGSAILNLLSRTIKTAVLLLTLASAAAADDYPNRPVRLIIPFPPGGSNDVVGRLVAKELSTVLGQQVFVDNRAGAGGTIGTEAASKTAPDGYTLLIISVAHAVSPALYKLEYDSIKSFTPISILATGPNVLVVNPELPAAWRRIVQAPGRRRHRACTVQRRRSGDARRTRRTRQDHVQLADPDRALHQIRAAQGAGVRRHQAQPGFAGRADNRRSRRAWLHGRELVGNCRAGRPAGADA